MTRNEKNNRVLVLTLFINYIVMNCVSAIQVTQSGKTALTFILPLVSSIIAAIVNIVLFKKDMGSKQIKVIGSIGYLIVYALFIQFGNAGGAAWALIIPLFITLAVYSDVKITIYVGLAGFVINAVNVILISTSGHFMLDMEMYRIFTIISSITVLIRVAAVNNRYNTIDRDQIIENEKKQEYIATSVLKTADKITNKLGKLSTISEGINESTQNITTAIESVTSAISYTAEKVQNQSEKTREIQASIENITNFTENVKTIAVDSKEAIDQGVLLVKKVKEKSDDVNHSNIEVSQSMAALRERMQEVIKIVDMISGISNQTNLLALNASIEAARAGESGRGFSVVADQIGQLAAQTKTSASEINQLIQALDQDASQAGKNLNTAIASVNEQNEGVNHVSDLFNHIDELIEKLEDNVVKSNEMITELASANSEIVDSTVELSSNVEEITASTEEIASLSTNNLEAVNETAEYVIGMVDDCKEFEQFK